MKAVLAVSGFVAGLVFAAAAPAEEMLRYETGDWIFTAPATLGTQADLELNGRQVQLCSDEIVALTGHRPPAPAKFTVQWVIDESVWYSAASAMGWVNSVPPSFRLVDDASRAFREDVVRRSVCFGPHEVTHVLTWPSFGGGGWANEGLATFTDFVYQSAAWRCCSPPPKLHLSCDETGYTDGFERRAYSDLSSFIVNFDMYRTAACFWVEAHRFGGLPAIRGILAGMRYQRPTTTGEFVMHHAGRVLNRDLRPIAARYGFEPAELEAGPTPRIPGCTLIGTGSGEVPGKDVARIDQGLDRVTGVERILP